MRHDPDAPNGMTEFLIASTAEALRGRGVARLSMNFAMWGRLFADEVPFTAGQRVARRLVGLLNPFFQIRSLRDFNARFGPEWLPRVLAYRRRTDLPRVGLLYAGAEGFLSVPGAGRAARAQGGRRRRRARPLAGTGRGPPGRLTGRSMIKYVSGTPDHLLVAGRDACSSSSPLLVALAAARVGTRRVPRALARAGVRRGACSPARLSV